MAFQMIAQHEYGRHITAVAIAVRVCFAIFLPEQLQRQVFMSLQLRMQLGEIQTRPRLRWRPQGRGWKELISCRSSISSGKGQVTLAAAAFSRYR